jgi:hypothetical protein
MLKHVQLSNMCVDMTDDSTLGLYNLAVKLQARLGVLQEKIIAQDIAIAYKYASNIINGPFPMAENLFATNCEYALAYALLIKKRFAQGEEVISKHCHVSYRYARFVVRGPFPLGEPAIAQDAEFSFYYAKQVLNGRFLAGEEAIAKNPHLSLKYMMEGLNNWNSQ